MPEPGKPETSHKLKLVASEVAKGAVTSLCEVSGDLLIAQAQKVCFNEIYFVFFLFSFCCLTFALGGCSKYPRRQFDFSGGIFGYEHVCY